MRRLSVLFGLTLILVMAAWEIYGFFARNEGIGYFASEPKRLLHVGILALAGGLVAFVIARLSPGSQRRLKLIALGTYGTLLFVFLGLLMWLSVWGASGITKAGMWGWVGAGCLSIAVSAALVWLEFWQVWSRG